MGVDRGSGGRREQRMVPDAQPTSYYGMPVLNPPVWQARDIAGYLFLGGLAGGSSVIGALAHATGRTRMAPPAKAVAVAAVGLSAAALVHDLGRPERFANMLRVCKPTSPMSVGSWLLAAYGPTAGVAAASAVSGRAPRTGAVASGAAAVLGSAVATYTAVLIADTAVPAWHEGRDQLPTVFAASALASAAGGALVLSPVAENGPARILAASAAVVEEAAMARLTRRLGPLGEPYHHGRAGVLLRAARALTVVGAVGAARFADRRLPAALAGGALLAGAACTRFGIFHAGVASASDPAATTVPQRERLDRAEASSRPARG